MQATQALLELLDTAADPFDRDFYEPGHVTAGAVTVADGQLLMVHHRRLGIWIEPGGHVDPTDRSPHHAAAREMAEETGVVGRLTSPAIFDVDSHAIPAAAGEPPHRHFNVCYLFTAELGPLRVADEVLAAKWVPLAEVATMSADPAIRRAVAKLGVASDGR